MVVIFPSLEQMCALGSKNNQYITNQVKNSVINDTEILKSYC